MYFNKLLIIERLSILFSQQYNLLKQFKTIYLIKTQNVRSISDKRKSELQV